MNDADQRYYDRATAVRIFGQDNAADFAAGSKALTLFASLDDLLKQLDEAKADQSPNRVSKETLIGELMIDLRNISRTSREIEKTQNGFAVPYRIPDNPSESAITTHADSVLRQLDDQPGDSATAKTAKTALRARFVEYETPADFVTHLRTDRGAITEANQHNQSENLDGVGNTKLISELIGKINDVIGGLDTIMFNKYTRVPVKLRAWQSASHTERAPQREKKPLTPPTPPA